MAKIQNLKVTIVHPVVDPSKDPSTLDVLDQVHLVEEALATMNIPYTTLAVTNGRVWEHSTQLKDTLVFNLLEAPPGIPQIQAASVGVLELLEIPFTGAKAATLWITTDKLATRALLLANSLPVSAGGRITAKEMSILEQLLPPWIIKPAWEDASVGLEGNPLCYTTEQTIERINKLSMRFPNQPLLLEHFLPGREFNVSLLATENGVEILPIAEIVFVDFPSDVPAFVSYEAKWEVKSFACIHTVRRFPSEEEDGDLLCRIRNISRIAWEVCDLSGYARIDLRCDEAGIPHILEVNANPCLSPDAGFMAASAQANLLPIDVVQRILNAVS
jgi:D-alanine-D-alanine ligase